MSQRDVCFSRYSARARFLRTMKFQAVDTIPNCELGPWPQTVQRWYQEGLGMRLPTGSCWNGKPYFGLEPLYVWLNGVNQGMLPPFEVAILEETDRYVVARKENGIVTRALREGFLDGQRMSMDQYLDFPVKNRDDFERLKERYDADAPARFPERLVDSKTRAVPLVCPGSVGLYMRLREWMGFENLSVAFHDQPDLIHDMLDFLVDFHLRIVDKIADRIDADLYDFPEDIAGKNGPLISPHMFEEFFAPRYKRIINHLREKGVSIFMLESDGNLELLMPQLIECGINANIPVEVAAGMDIVRLRKEYGTDMAWVGGIDKRSIAAGKEAIKQELDAKMPYIVEAGGCIPTIDGDLATDISLDNFQYYLELKTKYLEGRI